MDIELVEMKRREDDEFDTAANVGLLTDGLIILRPDIVCDDLPDNLDDETRMLIMQFLSANYFGLMVRSTEHYPNGAMNIFVAYNMKEPCPYFIKIRPD